LGTGGDSRIPYPVGHLVHLASSSVLSWLKTVARRCSTHVQHASRTSSIASFKYTGDVSSQTRARPRWFPKAALYRSKFGTLAGVRSHARRTYGPSTRTHRLVRSLMQERPAPTHFVIIVNATGNKCFVPSTMPIR
jgi:hypothetical protein